MVKFGYRNIYIGDMIKKKYILFISIICLFVSCIEERLKPEGTDETTTSIFVQGSNFLGSTDPRDNEIKTLRILAFRENGQCVSNILYSAALYETIRHPINDGIYNFVFLANEPTLLNIQNDLNTVRQYSDLKSITYPESVFRSDIPIPMFQEIKNVEVLPNEEGAKVNGGATQNPLLLRLERLASRVDIILEAEEDLTDYFTGVTLTNVPDGIKLMSDDNGGVDRTKIRKYTLANDADYFSDATPSASQQSQGIVWVKIITRFILPFNNFTPTDNSDKAFELTVDMVNRYSPSCKLRIETHGVNGATRDNYTLPFNSALLLTGIIKAPLELNVTLTPWGEENHNWQTGNYYLNVSDVNASITDFNGARITFSSNMPKVHVLPNLYIGESGTGTMLTEKVFNDLVFTPVVNSPWFPQDGNPVYDGKLVKYETSRFSYIYDTELKTGSGYMDILLDEYNEIHDRTFRLVLSGEAYEGGKLQREIKVHTRQEGYRFDGIHWAGYYVGAFFKDNEKGERIITGQKPRLENTTDLAEWHAWVEQGDGDIVLSTTPSFDPSVGTDTPGDAENYPVRPNEFKPHENGSYIRGRGRIYFRVAWKDVNPNPIIDNGLRKPRYAIIYLGHRWTTNWEPSTRIYIRQGEAADYLMNNGDVIELGPLGGSTRTKASKISVFNLTAPDYRNGNESQYYDLPQTKSAAFVKYPSQAGAFFQWTSVNHPRRAYHPTNPINNYLSTDWDDGLEKQPIWDDGTGTEYVWNHKEISEVCPPGYHRPNDGYTDQISYNGPYPNFKRFWPTPILERSTHAGDPADDSNDQVYSAQIAQSEWRQSLSLNPVAGELLYGFEATLDIQYPAERVGWKIYRYPTSPDFNEDEAQEKNIKAKDGFYADGYFDRRPIRIQQSSDDNGTRYGVSINTSQVAYRGCLFYNPVTGASVFFPSGGRRESGGGQLKYVGETGYYWSSSASPMFPNSFRNAWAHESRGSFIGNLSTPITTGNLIRCFRDN